MRCQEGEEGEDDPPLVPRLGTRTGSTLLFSTTTRFGDMKQKRNYSFLTSRSIAKTSYTIRSSGVLLQTGRVFLMTFIVGVKSYMEVSNEISDSSNHYFLTQPMPSSSVQPASSNIASNGRTPRSRNKGLSSLELEELRRTCVPVGQHHLRRRALAA